MELLFKIALIAVCVVAGIAMALGIDWLIWKAYFFVVPASWWHPTYWQAVVGILLLGWFASLFRTTAPTNQ